MYKYCIVPKCTNTSVKTPEKLFFNVPKDPKIRKKWCSVVKRDDKTPLSAKATRHCCEDHFDLENDMENYVKYKLVGGLLKLRKDVVPHKFACQKRVQDEKPERSVVKKRRINALLHKILNEEIPSASNDIEEVFIADPVKEEIQKEPDPLQIEEENHNNTNKYSVKHKSIQVKLKNKNIRSKGTMTDSKCEKTTHNRGTMTEEKYFEVPKPVIEKKIIPRQKCVHNLRNISRRHYIDNESDPEHCQVEKTVIKIEKLDEDEDEDV